jgi:hypothetical protein
MNLTQFSFEPNFTKVNLNGQSYNPLHELYKNSSNTNTFVCTQLFIHSKELNRLTNLVLPSSVKLLIHDRWALSCLPFTETYYQLGLINTFVRDFLCENIITHHKELMATLHKENIKVVRFILNTPIEETVRRIQFRDRTEESQKTKDFWLKFNETLFKNMVSTKFENVQTYICDETNIINWIQTYVKDISPPISTDN